MVAADMAAHAAQWISCGHASAADLDHCIQQLTSNAKAAMGAGGAAAAPPVSLSWRDWIPKKLMQWNSILGQKAGAEGGAEGGGDGCGAEGAGPAGPAAAAAAAAAAGTGSRKRSAAVLLEDSEDDAYGAPGGGGGPEFPEAAGGGGGGPFPELGGAPLPGHPPLPAQIFPASTSFPPAAAAAAPAAVPPRGLPAFADLDLRALELDLGVSPGLDDDAPGCGCAAGGCTDGGGGGAEVAAAAQQPPPGAVRQVIDDIMRRVREMWVARAAPGPGPHLAARLAAQRGAAGCAAPLPRA
jgi:hypothetical protein